MTAPGLTLPSSYDYRLVALSVLIAMFASYSALDLGGRTAAARGRARLTWLVGGATAMGVGIWSMHYIGMLAFSLPVTVLYDWPTVLLSLLAAIFAAAVALFVVSRQKMGWLRALTGSAIMGSGIATMHYTGMAAMRLPAMCSYDPALLTLSVVLAIVISLVAIWLTFRYRENEKASRWRKIASAVVMGAAIPVMHYTGMAAARFTPSTLVPNIAHAVRISSLGIAGISAVTLLVLGVAVLTSAADRRAEEALRQGEERFRHLVESVKDYAIFALDLDGRVASWNLGAERIKGYRAEEIIGRHFSCFFPEEDIRSLKPEEQLRTAISQGRVEDEGWRVRKDGSKFWANVVLTPLYDGAGRLRGFSKVTRDKSERKKVEDALAASEERFRNLAETANDAIVSADSRGNVVYFNRAAERMFLHSAGEVVGQPLTILMPEKFREAHRKGLDRYLRTGEAHVLGSTLELAGLRKDGSEFPLQLTLSGWRTREGMFFTGLLRDMTEPKKAEQKFKSLLESAPDAIVIVDTAGRITLVNSQTERVFGYPRSELLGQRVESLIPERYRGQHLQDRTKYALNPCIRPMGLGLELFGLRKDGTEFPVEISLSPLKTDQGTYVIGGIRDVTERKKAESQIRKLNRELEEALTKSEKLASTGRMATALAHEINSPLDSLVNVLYLLRSSANLSDRDKQLLGLAQVEVQRITTITRQTLAPHREVRSPVVTNVTELLDDVCSMFRQRMEATGIGVVRDFRSDGRVLVYPGEIRQVFTNLIANAIDAMPKGGRLQLQVSSQRSGVEINIVDSGCGIDREHFDKVFEPFFTTKGEKGTGVGLWVTKRIIEQLGGTIDVSGTTEAGQSGTKFRITLPGTANSTSRGSDTGSKELTALGGSAHRNAPQVPTKRSTHDTTRL
jgi:PAS domain S-box-containing protein